MADFTITVPFRGKVLDVSSTGQPVADPAVGVEAVDISKILSFTLSPNPAFDVEVLEYDLTTGNALVRVVSSDAVWLASAETALRAIPDLRLSDAAIDDIQIDRDALIASNRKAAEKVARRAFILSSPEISQAVRTKWAQLKASSKIN